MSTSYTKNTRLNDAVTLVAPTMAEMEDSVLFMVQRLNHDAVTMVGPTMPRIKDSVKDMVPRLKIAVMMAAKIKL